MGTILRRLLILVLGIALLLAPSLLRDTMWQYNARSYTAPDVPDLSFAATPVPTPTAIGLEENAASITAELRAGPVVVDLAHFNMLFTSSFQPLADALADRGVGLRLWFSPIDPMSITSFLAFPDQSEALAAQLKDASALVIVSPFFLWSPQEIDLVEQFVADGGRLLLISDPDIMSDRAADTNLIGEPFGVVFNDDYLYNTTTNDGNFTFSYQEAVADVADNLSGANIVFYGGRSISGDGKAQLRSVDGTLSSLRTGRSNFITALIAGIEARNTAGRVLALSDFDVLTDPYRTRHDNQQMVEFVADFLSGDVRVNRVADFPNYLGRHVNLAFGASSAINAELILQGAQIQQNLEHSGRTLELTDSNVLTGTAGLSTGSVSTDTDLIYLADYTTALSKTLLLTDLGLDLYTEMVTVTVPIEPEVEATPEEEDQASDDDTSGEEEPTSSATAAENAAPATLEPETTPTLGAPLTPPATLTSTRPLTATEQLVQAATPTPPPPVAGEGITATNTITGASTATNTVTVTATSTLTATGDLTPTIALTAPTALTTTMATTAAVATTATSTTAITTTAVTTTVQVEERVIITTYLRTQSGLTFLADETVLVVKTEAANGRKVLAVLAASNRGIDAGVNRLLTNDFSGCVIGETLTFCSLPADDESDDSHSSAPGATPAPAADEGGDPSDPEATPTSPAPPRGADAPILLIDDNADAEQGEVSEADIYLQPLVEGGYEVDLWSVSDQGAPPLEELLSYGWVIWSNGGYANGQIDGEDLDTIFAFVGSGGRLTISSRTPLPGLEESAPLNDVVVATDVPELVADLPTDAIAVTGEDTNAAVLSALPEDDESTWVVLRRGPASDNADAPVMVVLADSADTELRARLMVGALSLSWLPADESKTLVNNMAAWMLAE